MRQPRCVSSLVALVRVSYPIPLSQRARHVVWCAVPRACQCLRRPDPWWRLAIADRDPIYAVADARPVRSTRKIKNSKNTVLLQIEQGAHSHLSESVPCQARHAHRQRRGRPCTLTACRPRLQKRGQRSPETRCRRTGSATCLHELPGVKPARQTRAKPAARHDGDAALCNGAARLLCVWRTAARGATARDLPPPPRRRRPSLAPQVSAAALSAAGVCCCSPAALAATGGRACHRRYI